MVRKSFKTRSTLCFLSAAVFWATGCGNDPNPTEVVLTMQNMAGIYYGVTFTTEEGGVVTDQLRLGSTIELILHGFGTTEGRLFIPPGGCCETDVTLNGTWALDGNIVTLSLTADSFLKDMVLEFSQTHLTGETVIGGVTYRVVLAL